MNPLSRNRTISRPLNAPISAPTASVIGIAQPPGDQAEPVGDTRRDGQPRGDARREAERRLQRQVHLAGDQHQRLGEHQDRDLGHRLQHVEQVVGVQEHRVDDLPDDRDHDDRRDQREVAQAGDGDPPVADRTREPPGRSRSRTWPCSDMIEIDPFHSGNQVVVAPAAGHFAHDAALEHHQDAVAYAQVVEFVGHHQRRPYPQRAPARRLPAASPWIARRRRRSDRSAPARVGSLASARAITTFCWLPPERLATGNSGPGVLMVSVSIRPWAQRVTALGADRHATPEPSGERSS